MKKILVLALTLVMALSMVAFAESNPSPVAATGVAGVRAADGSALAADFAVVFEALDEEDAADVKAEFTAMQEKAAGQPIINVFTEEEKAAIAAKLPAGFDLTQLVAGEACAVKAVNAEGVGDVVVTVKFPTEISANTVCLAGCKKDAPAEGEDAFAWAALDTKVVDKNTAEVTLPADLIAIMAQQPVAFMALTTPVAA